VESEEEEEVAPLLIQSRRSRDPTTLKGTEVAEGPQSKTLLASLMTSGEGVTTGLSKHYDAGLEDRRIQSDY